MLRRGTSSTLSIYLYGCACTEVPVPVTLLVSVCRYKKIESADCFSKSDCFLLLNSSIVNCPIIYYHSSISTAKIPYDLVKLIGPAMHSPEQAGMANTRELANLASTWTSTTLDRKEKAI